MNQAGVENFGLFGELQPTVRGWQRVDEGHAIGTGAGSTPKGQEMGLGRDTSPVGLKREVTDPVTVAQLSGVTLPPAKMPCSKRKREENKRKCVRVSV